MSSAFSLMEHRQQKHGEQQAFDHELDLEFLLWTTEAEASEGAFARKTMDAFPSFTLDATHGNLYDNARMCKGELVLSSEESRWQLHQPMQHDFHAFNRMPIPLSANTGILTGSDSDMSVSSTSASTVTTPTSKDIPIRINPSLLRKTPKKAQKKKITQSKDEPSTGSRGSSNESVLFDADFEGDALIEGDEECSIADSTTKSGKKSSRAGCARWTQAEEIILEGVATDCNMLCGGAAPWEQIAQYYNIAVNKFFERHEKSLKAKLPKRTVCGLRKHYRIMHLKSKEYRNLPKDFWYNLYHFRWMSEGFNQSQKLVNYADFRHL